MPKRRSPTRLNWTLTRDRAPHRVVRAPTSNPRSRAHESPVDVLVLVLSSPAQGSASGASGHVGETLLGARLLAQAHGEPMVVRVRAGNRYVERPLRELIIEAIGTPFIVLALWRAMRGWSH